MNQIRFGQFIRGDSTIHRIDPRLKIFFVLVFIFLLFFTSNIYCYSVLLFAIGIGILTSRIPLFIYFKAQRQVLLLVFLIIILQLFVVHGGGKESILNAVLFSSRLFLFMLLLSLLTFTTSPVYLAEAFGWYLRPLKCLKLPIEEIKLMFSIALRFIPTMWEEIDKIRMAQMARGVDFETRSLGKRLINYTRLLIPLLHSTFRRSELLVMAMESRGYRIGQERTSYRQLRVTMLDFYFICFMVIMVLAVLVFFDK